MHYFCLCWVSDKSHNFLYPTFTVFKQNDKPMRKSPKRRKNTYHYYYYYVALAKDEDDRAAFARSCVLSRIQWSERLYRSMMLKKSPAGVPPLVQCPHAFQIFHLNNPQPEKKYVGAINLQYIYFDGSLWSSILLQRHLTIYFSGIQDAIIDLSWG